MKNILIISLIFFFGCKSEIKKELTAQEIVDKSIKASGLDKIENSTITFQFRNKKYKAIRNNGKYELERSFDSIKDVLYNDGFKRFVNDKLVETQDSMKSRYSNSVNSVHYFSVLPFGLNDKAVNKKLLSSVKIKDKEYYKIEVTFNENGGGDDFEDVFIYWISKKSYFVDYLAYSYHTNSGGIRFRELSEQCVKKGIRFVDYINYKPQNKEISIEAIDKAYMENKLTKVSEIILRNIEVKLN